MSEPNPFAALSLIVAPAVLTNASSILVLSTSNRLARAIDRARALATQLEAPAGIPDRFTPLRLKELASSEERALMLLSALRLFYASLGAFAGAALTSLLGAGVSGAPPQSLAATLELVAVGAGFIGVLGLILGCLLLVRETRLAVLVVSEEAPSGNTSPAGSPEDTSTAIQSHPPRCVKLILNELTFASPRRLERKRGAE